MKTLTFRISSLVMILLLISGLGLFSCSNNGSEPEIKVLIIHSYHEGWGWGQGVQRGIVEGLSRKGYTEGRDYELKTFYMDTKVTYTTTEQIEQRADKAIDLIGEFEPDIVFVNDDDALKYVAVEYVDRYPDEDPPFVFCGVNIDPTIYDPIEGLDAPGGSITGLLERIPYYQTFSLGKRIRPDATNIVVLADPSSSSTFVLNAFQERYLDVVPDSPLEVIGLFQLTTFQEWKNTVTEYQTKVDFLGIINYHQLRDEAGNVVPSLEVMNWTLQNSDLPEICILTSHVEDGFLAAAGASGDGTGIYAGVMGGEILNGADPGTIPIVDPGVIDIAFNLAREKMLGISIPFAELVAADEVYQSIKALANPDEKGLLSY